MLEIVDNLVTSMRAGLLAKGVKVIWGYSIKPPTSNLPCLCITPGITKQTVNGTGHLKKEYFNIELKLYVGLRENMKQTTEQIEYMRELVSLMEKRNTTTWRPESDTVLGILDADLSLGGTVGTITPAESIRYTDRQDDRVGVATLLLTAERILN